MAKSIHTQITISATPERVWGVLTGFSGYSEWNPFIRSIEGAPEPGKKITVHIVPPGSKGMKFVPRVLQFDRNREFRWLGRLFLPGIFDGEHRFQLTANPDGTTTFHHSEAFRGLLVPFLKKMLEVDTKNGFLAMNEALKKRCENQE